MENINEVELELVKIANEISTILTNNFVGFYVFGSFANGSWNANTSDIDYFVVLNKPLNDVENKNLEVFHNKILVTELGQKLEGDYVDLKLLQNKEFFRLIGCVKKGIFLQEYPCPISADNILSLIEDGKKILGKEIKELKLSVSAKELLMAEINMLEEDLVEIDFADDFSSLLAILINALRCIYVLRTHKLPTKRLAVEYNKDIVSAELYENILKYLNGEIDNFSIDKTILRKLIEYGLSLN